MVNETALIGDNRGKDEIRITLTKQDQCNFSKIRVNMSTTVFEKAIE